MLKQPCKICKKEFTIKTLTMNRRNGNCGRCFSLCKTRIIVPKKKKTTISSAIKDAVWRKEIGDINKFEIRCPVCLDNKITSRNFQCGHIIAESKGGDSSVNNLRPICGSCNTSMGTTHMNDFIKNLWIGREKERDEIIKEANIIIKEKPIAKETESSVPTDEIIDEMNELFYPIYRDFQNIICNRYTAWEMNTIYKLGKLDKIRETNGKAYTESPLLFNFDIVSKSCKKCYDTKSGKSIQWSAYAKYLGFLHVLGLMQDNIDNYNAIRDGLSSKKYFVEVKPTDVSYYSKECFRLLMLKCLYSQGGHRFTTFNEWKNARESYEFTQFDSHYEDYIRIKLPDVHRTKKTQDYF